MKYIVFSIDTEHMVGKLAILRIISYEQIHCVGCMHDSKLLVQLKYVKLTVKEDLDYFC